MRARPTRRYRSTLSALVLGLLLTALVPALALAAAPAQPAGPWTADTAAESVAGYVINDLVSDLKDDNVAVPDGAGSASELASVAAQARSNGVNLSVVSVAKSLTRDDAKLMAGLVRSKTGGSVLVLSPSNGGYNSDEVSDAKQEEAGNAAGKYLRNPTEAAKRYADVLTAKGFPWVLVVIGLLVVGVGVAMFLGFRRRRESDLADEAQLKSLTETLHERVSKLAPLVLANSSRVDLAQRADLTEKATRAGAEYNRLRELLSTPMRDRADLNEATAEVTALEKSVADVDAELDRLLPGLEPPTT